MKDTDTERRTEAEVRASLEQSTEDLRSALERLELGAREKIDDAKEKLDVGRRITDKGPVVYVAGFVVGLVIGMITFRPRRRYY